MSAKTATLDLFIFADALGWALAEDRQFMPDLFPHRQRCDTLLGYSCTCDPSILTGKLPSEHGHFSFFVFDQKKAGPFGWSRGLGWLPEAIAGHHRVRNKISKWTARRAGYTGYFQLYSVPFGRLPWLDYTEKLDIYEPGGILGGQPTIFEHWKRSGLPWTRSDWRSHDEARVARLKAELEQGEVRLAYLFTAELDAAMHAHTTQSAATDAAFARFEKWVRELHEIASRRYETVRFHLFSDHGMKDTEQVSRMMLEFEKLGLKFGRDYIAVWDSTMVRFWFLGSAQVREEITAWLGSRLDGRMLGDEELRELGCFFPNREYGELFYLLHNGTIFAPSFMNQRRVPGMHGFHPSERESAACWLTTHPVARPPERIEQIYDVMCAAAEKARGAAGLPELAQA